ncbi:hypothetical protein KHQ81_05910 [Mycoplasmatota bacterium]|nr:hypothetical protein KHQ81_05910 [Mycoplasmatota bacterium]
MYKKDSYVFVGLILVFCSAMGLLASIVFKLNIPLALIIGAVIGIIIGSVIDLLIRNKRESKS